jgi:hypothetical protein
MTTIALENIVTVVLIVAGLAAVCRLAYRVAGGLLDGKAEQSAPVQEPERLAA